MANTIELRDAKSLNEFSDVAENIRATIPEELHPAIFTRLIIATRGMTVADPCGTPLSIWTINLDAIGVVLAMRHLNVSNVSHVNPIDMIDAMKDADPSQYEAILESLSGTDPDSSIDPKLMIELLQKVGVDVLKFLIKGANVVQTTEWVLDHVKDWIDIKDLIT